MSVTGQAFDFKILKRVSYYIKPYRTIFYISAILTLVVAILGPVRPLILQYTFDHFVATPDPDHLLYMTMFMIGILLTQGILQYYHAYLTNLLGQSIVKDLRVKLFSNLLNFKLTFFNNTPLGTLITRLVSDMETIADIFSEGLIIIIGDILQLLVLVVVMFVMNWRLALASLSVIPLLLIATKYFQIGIRESFKEVRIQVANLNTFVQEHLTGVSVVQLYGREEPEMNKFKEINQKHAKANIRSVWYYSIFFPVVELLSATALGLLVWWGAKGVIAGWASLGDMVAFILFLNMLFRPLRELADKFNTLQMGMVSSERIFKLMDSAGENLDSNTGTYTETTRKCEIDFENVWFAYKNEDYVLKDISFHLPAGKSLALVGATGAGKSSIVNLISRFYEINKGSIKINHRDIKDYELLDLRAKAGVVLQDVFLFADTIYQNITLRNPDITKEMVIQAAKETGAHDFIMRLPDGYEFEVGERGGMLSAGQRQLISFIRAYVYNPAILILDEATSSIDTETEAIIQYATTKLTENRTSIIVAHRLATVQRVDQILVLDHGEIKERGNHQELLKQNGIYKKLFEMQFDRVVI